MTSNQIAYQKNLETIRSNLESERATRARDSETGRHNLATELEAGRANRVSEELRRDQNSIARSHYERQDSLGESRLAADLEHMRSTRAETERSNRARETETSLHNSMSELIDRDRIDQAAITNTAQGADRILPGAGTIVSGVNAITRLLTRDKNTRSALRTGASRGMAGSSRSYGTLVGRSRS